MSRRIHVSVGPNGALRIFTREYSWYPIKEKLADYRIKRVKIPGERKIETNGQELIQNRGKAIPAIRLTAAAMEIHGVKESGLFNMLGLADAMGKGDPIPLRVFAPSGGRVVPFFILFFLFQRLPMLAVSALVFLHRRNDA